MTSVTKPVDIQAPRLLKAMKAPRKLPEMRVTRSQAMNQQLLAKENPRVSCSAAPTMTPVKIKTESEDQDKKPVDLLKHSEEQTKERQLFNSPFLNVESIACAGEQNKYYTATLKLDEVLVVACTSLRTLMKVTTLISHNMDSEVIKIETCEKEAIGRSSNEESLSSSITDSLNMSVDDHRKYSTQELVKLASHTLCQRYPADWDTITEKFPEIISMEPQYFNPSDYEKVQFTNLFNKPVFTNKTIFENYRPATVSDNIEDRRYVPVNNVNQNSLSEIEDVKVQPTLVNKPPARRLPHLSSLVKISSSCDQSLSAKTDVMSKYQNIHSMSSIKPDCRQDEHYLEGNTTAKVEVISESKSQQMYEQPLKTNLLTGQKTSDDDHCKSEEQLWKTEVPVEKSPKKTSSLELRSPCSNGFLQGKHTSTSEQESPNTRPMAFGYLSPRSEGLLQETVASKLELYKTIAESRNKNISLNDSFVSDKIYKTASPTSDGLVNQPNFYGGQFMRAKAVSYQTGVNVNNSYNNELWLDNSGVPDTSSNNHVELSSRALVPREQCNKFIAENITEYGLVNDPLRSIDTSRYM